MLDGMPTVNEYIQRLQELNFEGIALTEHGNMRSMLKLFKAAKGGATIETKQNGIIKTSIAEPVKPIAGIEFYLSHLSHKIRGVPDTIKTKLERKATNKTDYKGILAQYEKEHGYRIRYHVLAFAKNEIGLKNLYMLNYLSWKDGYYYRPRIDIQLLLKYREGIVITSACIGSPIAQYIIKGDEQNTEKIIRIFKKYFKDDFYLELQPHDIEEQKKVNASLVYYASKYKVKLIATNDSHYLKKQDYLTHEVLLAVQSHKTMQSTDRWRFGDHEFYIKTKEEMLQTFKRNHAALNKNIVIEALENTAEIAEKCNLTIELDTKKGILPDVNILLQGADTPKEKMLQIVKYGWHWRKMNVRIQEYATDHSITFDKAKRIYRDRIKLELDRIFKMNFESYFLVVHDYIKWCRDNDILTGPGRGSSGGSLVAFLMGITSIDSVKYDMLFDRFLTEERIDYPDIDSDFQDDKRHLVVEYLKTKYGEDKVSNVITVGRMQGKACLLDVSRVFEIPVSETHAVTKHIIKRNDGDARAGKTVEDSFKEFDICKKYDAKYPDVLKHVKKLEGKARQTGVHAAGIQITPEPIYTMVPVEYAYKDKKEKQLVTSFDWKDSQEIGLIKFDLLGLKTLTVLAHARDMIKERHNKTIVFEDINLEDEKTLQLFTQKSFAGLFQFDSIGMVKTCKYLTFDAFNDVMAMNAMYRPGTMRTGVTRSYIKRKAGREKIENLHREYDKITKDTYGLIIYQEQLLKVLRDVASFTPQRAEKIRKIVGKSQGREVINKEKIDFVIGAVKNGMKKEDASKLFDNMAAFSEYAFNKAHAGAYGMIAVWTMYLKANYPKEFYLSLLKNEDTMDNVIRFVKAARSDNVAVLMPDVNYSKHSFTIDKTDSIRSGLIDIKGCGEKAAENIEQNGPYKNMADFREKVNARIVNRGVVKSLIHAGAFKQMYPNTKALLTEIAVPRKKRGGEMVMDAIPFWQLLWDGKRKDKDYRILESDITMTEEDEVNIQHGYCPIPSFKHKMEYYAETIEKLKLDNFVYINDMGKSNRAATIAGVIVEVKYNNVGDYQKSEISDEAKKRMGWGRRNCSINIDDGTGIIKISINANIFPLFSELIDNDKGAPIIVYGNSWKAGDILIAECIANLDSIKSKLSKTDNTKLTPVEKLFVYGNRFVKSLLMKTRSKGIDGIVQISRAKKIHTGIKQTAAIVLNVKEHWTKKNDCMAFISLYDGKRMDMVIWPDEYESNKDVLKIGNLVELQVLIKTEKTKQSFYLNNKSTVTKLKQIYGTKK